MSAGAVRRHATTLALIAAAVGLGTYVFVVDRADAPGARQDARAKNVFPAYARDGVVRIEIDSEKGHVDLVHDRSPDAGAPGSRRSRARPPRDSATARRWTSAA